MFEVHFVIDGENLGEQIIVTNSFYIEFHQENFLLEVAFEFKIYNMRVDSFGFVSQRVDYINSVQIGYLALSRSAQSQKFIVGVRSLEVSLNVVIKHVILVFNIAMLEQN